MNDLRKIASRALIDVLNRRFIRKSAAEYPGATGVGAAPNYRQAVNQSAQKPKPNQRGSLIEALPNSAYANTNWKQLAADTMLWSHPLTLPVMAGRYLSQKINKRPVPKQPAPAGGTPGDSEFIDHTRAGRGSILER